jgi:hypothetical protein
LLSAFAEQHGRGNHLVSISEHVGGDNDFFADGSLDRKSAAVDLGFDAFDDHATQQLRIEV